VTGWLPLRLFALSVAIGGYGVIKSAPWIYGPGQSAGLSQNPMEPFVTIWMWNFCMACPEMTVFGAEVPLGKAPISWITGCARQSVATVHLWDESEPGVPGALTDLPPDP
jgi:hypothetical protein